MRPRQLDRRIDRVQQLRPPKPPSEIDRTSVTDAELERLEGLALRAMAFTNRPVFMASLGPEDHTWLEGIGSRVGIVLAIGEEMR